MVNNHLMIPGNVTHENSPDGGIPIGDSNLVESDEFLVNIGGKDYVFSRRLMFSKKTSFAQQAQRIQNKYKGREDKLSIESMEREFEQLMNMQEQVRTQMEQETNAKSEKAFNRFAKKHGGFLNNVLGNGGILNPSQTKQISGIRPIDTFESYRMKMNDAEYNHSEEDNWLHQSYLNQHLMLDHHQVVHHLGKL